MPPKLADQSVVYPRAYSVASYTAKSLGAVLSGRYPSSLYRWDGSSWTPLGDVPGGQWDSGSLVAELYDDGTGGDDFVLLDVRSEEEWRERFSKILVSVGRKPVTESITGLDLVKEQLPVVGCIAVVGTPMRHGDNYI